MSGSVKIMGLSEYAVCKQYIVVLLYTLNEILGKWYHFRQPFFSMRNCKQFFHGLFVVECGL